MPPAGNILALDIGGARTGWACGSPGDAVAEIASGSRGFVHGADLGLLFQTYADWLADKITDLEPKIIAIEPPLSGRHAGGNAAYILDGLAAITELIAYRREIALRKIHTATVRKRFCGSGRAKKPDVLAECIRRGFNPRGFDEADALALLMVALQPEPEEREAA